MADSFRLEEKRLQFLEAVGLRVEDIGMTFSLELLAVFVPTVETDLNLAVVAYQDYKAGGSLLVTAPPPSATLPTSTTTTGGQAVAFTEGDPFPPELDTDRLGQHQQPPPPPQGNGDDEKIHEDDSPLREKKKSIVLLDDNSMNDGTTDDPIIVLDSEEDDEGFEDDEEGGLNNNNNLSQIPVPRFSQPELVLGGSSGSLPLLSHEQEAGDALEGNGKVSSFAATTTTTGGGGNNVDTKFAEMFPPAIFDRIAVIEQAALYGGLKSMKPEAAPTNVPKPTTTTTIGGEGDDMFGFPDLQAPDFSSKGNDPASKSSNNNNSNKTTTTGGGFDPFVDSDDDYLRAFKDLPLNVKFPEARKSLQEKHEETKEKGTTTTVACQRSPSNGRQKRDREDEEQHHDKLNSKNGKDGRARNSTTTTRVAVTTRHVIGGAHASHGIVGASRNDDGSPPFADVKQEGKEAPTDPHKCLMFSTSPQHHPEEQQEQDAVPPPAMLEEEEEKAEEMITDFSLTGQKGLAAHFPVPHLRWNSASDGLTARAGVRKSKNRPAVSAIEVAGQNQFLRAYDVRYMCSSALEGTNPKGLQPDDVLGVKIGPLRFPCLKGRYDESKDGPLSFEKLMILLRVYSPHWRRGSNSTGDLNQQQRQPELDGVPISAERAELMNRLWQQDDVSCSVPPSSEKNAASKILHKHLVILFFASTAAPHGDPSACPARLVGGALRLDSDQVPVLDSVELLLDACSVPCNHGETFMCNLRAILSAAALLGWKDDSSSTSSTLDVPLSRQNDGNDSTDDMNDTAAAAALQRRDPLRGNDLLSEELVDSSGAPDKLIDELAVAKRCSDVEIENVRKKLAEDGLVKISPKLHQLDSIAWMHKREKDGFRQFEKVHLPSSNTVLKRSYGNEKLCNGFIFYFDKTSGTTFVYPSQSSKESGDDFVNPSVRGGWLGDEMGLGKTLCLLSLVALDPRISSANEARKKHAHRFVNVTMVVVPLTLLGYWQGEIKKTYPTLDLVTYHCSSKAREKNRWREAQIVLTTYHTFRNQIRNGEFSNVTFRRVAFDESQTLSNRSGFDRFRSELAMTGMRSLSVWFMSGTPFAGNFDALDDYLSIIHVQKSLSTSRVNSQDQFKSAADSVREVIQKYGCEPLPRNFPYFRPTAVYVKSHMVRHIKAHKEVSDSLSLPPRKLVVHRYDMPQVERDVYEEVYRLFMHDLAAQDPAYYHDSTFSARINDLRHLIVGNLDRFVDPTIALERREERRRREAEKYEVSNIHARGLLRLLKEKKEEQLKRIEEAKQNPNITPGELAQLSERIVPECIFEILNDMLQDAGNNPKLTECMICTSEMENPIVLECHHCYCFTCVKNLIKTRTDVEEQWGGHGRGLAQVCPMCHAHTLHKAKHRVTLEEEEEEEEEEDADGENKKVASSQQEPAQQPPQQQQQGPTPMVALRQARRAGMRPSRHSELLRLLRTIWGGNPNQGDGPKAKVVIFSSLGWTEVVEFLRSERINIEIIGGGLTALQRGAIVKKFQDPDSDLRVCFLAGAQAGLTLTAAHHIISLEPSLDVAMEAQAMGRVHRIGQKWPVTVHRLIAKDTVEERILDLTSGASEDGPKMSTLSKTQQEHRVLDFVPPPPQAFPRGPQGRPGINLQLPPFAHPRH